MSNAKREQVFQAIRANGPFKAVSLQAYLGKGFTKAEINKAVAELVYLERVAITKEQQLTAK
jgi:hypothetical protein